MKKLLITGTAGFIGNALALELLARGYDVVGIDNVNDYYDVSLKVSRLNRIKIFTSYSHYQIDISDWDSLSRVFQAEQPEIVINLAAQAGVRYSITNPDAYVESNLVGFSNIIELSSKFKVSHFIYASSSSVYGNNKKLPFCEDDVVDTPLSLYAATKKSNEMIAHSYSNIHGLPTTGLRFFTVYGPWGRPDMALFLFTKSIIETKPLHLFNNGNHKRSFTYIDDVVNGLVKVVNGSHLHNINNVIGDSSSYKESSVPWYIYNLGNENTVMLIEYVKYIEMALGKNAIIENQPMQLGDVESAMADMSKFKKSFGFVPEVKAIDGVKSFVDWYKSYYGY